MPEIEKHLHQLSQLIREQDSIKLVVRLESLTGSRVRYLAVVSCNEENAEEFCLLGIDGDQDISLGLVLAILSYTTIRLDGDGGFCVTTGDGLRSHIFKPVSVQTMWSALQSLYRASECAKENNSFQASAIRYYENIFSSYKSDPSCLIEWNILPGVEYRRPMTLDFTSEELSFQEKISCILREILMCERDLDEVTSKEIRTKLECKLKLDLSHYKSFIDEEMLRIVGQMEAPALILDHLYLGTEWNASHQQDLFDKDINYILNVTTEIDNFFPDMFRYMNIPVCDTEETNILRYFNDSYKFINKARKEGKNVLVHCKMGISRSATIVIAYVMKTRNWDLCRSLRHVKSKRNCVKPNPNFMKQLEVYEGILAAKRFSTTLEKRSKSESNLKQNDKSPLLSASNERTMCSSNSDITDHMDSKAHKKYFNTAPARLKPEKHSRKLTDILKPKSSSCAAILMDKPEPQELYDIVPQEVMSSFKHAVNELEQTSPTRNPYFGPQDSSCEASRIIEFSVSPAITVTSPEHESLEEERMEEEPIEPQLPSCEPEQGSSISGCSSSTIPPCPEPTSLVDESSMMTVDGSQDESKKIIMSLKCCRRPYNGHTFSVSPNQVVNITSIMDSKYSVRHLVNEFELQSKYTTGDRISPSSQESLLSQKRSPRRTKVRSKLFSEICDTDTSGEETDATSTTIKEPFIQPAPCKTKKKSDTVGCLPFLRKYSLSSSKSSSNSISFPGGSSHKNKSPRKGKILETVAKLNETGEFGGPQEFPKYTSTGVVKQRLEAFEAKAGGTQHFFRSHARSHSATSPSGSLESFTHLSQRKSSMPQLGQNADDFESGAPSFPRYSFLQDRKSSLDSHALFKSFPCPMVRGFQTSGSKSFFSTSPNSTSRVQHGSTHPLNLLPRTPTLT